MLKRTTVKFLLAVLVITGLAGTVDHASLTASEKKMVIKALKESREQFLSEYKKFSRKQAAFLLESEGMSANILLDFQERWEDVAWEKLKQAMQKAAPEDGKPACTSYTAEPAGWTVYPPLSSLSEQGNPDRYKTLRQVGIRYVRNSTQNFKTHYVGSEAGCITGYQYILRIIERTNWATAQLRLIRQHPQFPAE